MSLDESGMESFQYTALPARVVFGFGTLEKVAGELGSLGRNRAFVLSDPHHATAAAARLMRPRRLRCPPVDGCRHAYAGRDH